MGVSWKATLGGRVVRWAGVTLLALPLTGGFLVHSGSPQSLTLTTHTAELRTIPLNEGSRVQLNTRTRLEWFGDATERRVVLHEGEAFFEVTPDPGRPFRVEVAQSVIRVLGTGFNVYRKANGNVIVTVLDGTVRVAGGEGVSGEPTWHRELHANQRVEYGREGVIDEVSTSSTPPIALKWREGMLQFQNELLPKVIEELQRYTDQQIIIGDERLKALKVLGSVNTQDVRAALARLGKTAPVSVVERGDWFELNYRD